MAAGVGAMTAGVPAETRLAIEALVHEHAWLIDHGHASQVAALYTEDARMLGVGPEKVGREAIAAWAQDRETMTQRRSRHVQTNLRLEAVSPAEVRGTVVLTLYRHDGDGPGSGAPLLIGEYQDVYQQGGDGQWRFSHRGLAVLFGG